jgi:hypothetical protein
MSRAWLENFSKKEPPFISVDIKKERGTFLQP